MDHRFTVTAGAFSLDDKTNFETAAQWNVDNSHVYRDYLELFEREKGQVDAVAVLTPTQSHADISIAAILAGFPVICEKSMTASVADAMRMKNAVSQHHGFLAVTYNYTGYPMVRQIRALIREGAIGHLCQIMIEMPQDGFLRLDGENKPLTPQQWRLDNSELPIISTDLGVHLTNMIGFLSAQKPIELLATQNRFGNFDVVDTVNCIAHYTNDLVCNIWFSKIALGYRNGLNVRIFGDKGFLMWRQMEPEALVMTDAHGTTKTLDRANAELRLTHLQRYNRFKAGHPAGFIEAFANCYGDIGDALLGYASCTAMDYEYIFSVDDALTDIRSIDAMNCSAISKAWVKVDQP